MLITELLPLIVGAAVLPLWIIISLLLLRSEGGVAKAAAFAGGAMAVRVVQGLLFGFVFGTATDEYGETGAALIKSTLLLVVGILLLVAAYKKWRKEDDPDAPPPKWMSALSGLSTLKAFGMGALLMAIAVKQWVFTLSAIAVILLPFDIGVRRITVSLRKLFGFAGASLGPATSIEGSGRMGQLMQAKSRVTRAPNQPASRRVGSTRSGAPSASPASSPSPSPPIQTEPPQASATASELLRRRKKRESEGSESGDKAGLSRKDEAQTS
jgi:hypothetical protein